MTGFLIILGTIVAVLYLFVRLFRARVQRRMEGVELPAELVTARQATAVRAAQPAGRHAQELPGPPVGDLDAPVAPREQHAVGGGVEDLAQPAALGLDLVEQRGVRERDRGLVRER